MRSVVRSTLIVLGVAALAALAATSAGCGSGGTGGSPSPAPTWTPVTSVHVSGVRPIKLNLGAFGLGDRLRVAWVLSGPQKPPVVLTLRIINTENGLGRGQVVTPRSAPQPVARRDDQAMTLTLIPGTYRIYFSQRFPRSRGPGYDIALSFFTMRTTP